MGTIFGAWVKYKERKLKISEQEAANLVENEAVNIARHLFFLGIFRWRLARRRRALYAEFLTDIISDIGIRDFSQQELQELIAKYDRRNLEWFSRMLLLV